MERWCRYARKIVESLSQENNGVRWLTEEVDVKSSYHVAMVTAVALSVSLLAPPPGLGQTADDDLARARLNA